MSGENHHHVAPTRMLERRVSNNRADLNSDQQMNYFLGWFQSWSDLQKSDFVPILAQKTGQAPPEMNGLSLNDSNQKPMSLFQCQLKLFKEYVVNWNPDQVEYLVMRLKDLDTNFYNKYEEYLEYGDDIHKKPKDFFEPGVPPELVRASRKDSSVSSSPNVSINGKDSDADVPSAEEEPNEENNDNNIFENIRENQHLSTIQEDE